VFGKGGPHFYDPKENDWSALSPKGPKPPKPFDAASCYDSKRNRIYIAMGSYPKKEVPDGKNRVFAYDVAKNTWIDLKATGDLPPLPPGVSGCGTTKLHYDAANDTLIFQHKIAQAKPLRLNVPPEKSVWGGSSWDRTQFAGESAGMASTHSTCRL